jgi:hypothetical protein
MKVIVGAVENDDILKKGCLNFCTKKAHLLEVSCMTSGLAPVPKASSYITKCYGYDLFT